MRIVLQIIIFIGLKIWELMLLLLKGLIYIVKFIPTLISIWLFSYCNNIGMETDAVELKWAIYFLLSLILFFFVLGIQLDWIFWKKELFVHDLLKRLKENWDRSGRIVGKKEE